MKFRLMWGTLFCALSLLFSSQVASQTIDEQMTQLEDEMWNSLGSLKQNSQNLIDELNDLKKLREISDQTLNELKQSLDVTLNLYNNCAQQLQNTRIDLQKKQSQNRKLTIVLIVLIGLFIIVRVGLIFLKFKGVEVPYLINLLL